MEIKLERGFRVAPVILHVLVCDTADRISWKIAPSKFQIRNFLDIRIVHSEMYLNIEMEMFFRFLEEELFHRPT